MKIIHPVFVKSIEELPKAGVHCNLEPSAFFVTQTGVKHEPSSDLHVQHSAAEFKCVLGVLLERKDLDVVLPY